MRTISIVLACLVCAGQGRRVQTRPELFEPDAEKEVAESTQSNMLARLVDLLMKPDPSAAWRINLPGAGNFAPRHAASNSAGISPAVQRAPAVDNRAKVSMEAEATAEATPAAGESYEFEAEVTKVMDIIINSLYSDKDIFLRELVSNAADACDKRRFLSITDDKVSGADGRIRIIADKKSNTLTIEDNGIGMTRAELKDNLGRIANSGTKKFAEMVKAQDTSNLIGQFGVGFYSAFLVADKVAVISKPLDGPQLRWESQQASKFTISEDDSAPIESTGTRLVLTLKEDADKYLDDFTLRDMLKKYSEFIDFPIELWTEKTEYDKVPDPDAEVKEGEEPKMKTVPRTTNVWERVNAAEPLWMRQPREVKDEEYSEFYKTTFKAYDEPMAKTHFSLEGQVEFRAMLFVPSSVPWELSQDMFNDDVKPVKLYVKRVFISDKFAEDLLPRWLSFLKGIVDSDDLPLNVSREILQKSRVLSIMRKRIVRKALDMFKDMADDEPAKFKKFTENFGRYIKVGVIEDQANKDELLKVATFTSSAGKEPTTLDQYKSRMKENQKAIYYLVGSSRASAEASPALEGLKKKGIEVIYALDQIDEVALQGIGKFGELDVVDVGKENVDLGDLTEDEKKEVEDAKEDLKPTCDYLKSILGKRVDKVSVSTRLTSSPGALVQPQWGMSPQMQRFMKQRAAAGDMPGQAPEMAANLEINPKHAVVTKLKGMVANKEDLAKEYAELLYDISALSSGYDLSDTGLFAKRVAAIMGGGDQALGKIDEKEEEAATTKVPADTGDAAPIEPEVIED